MRVVIHHTEGISAGTKMALLSERVHHWHNDNPHNRPPAIDFEVSYVRCQDRHDYGDSLARLWEKGESFINLEHDVAPWPGALTQMWECDHLWCALPLIVHGCVNETNLGCVKFTRDFMKMYPDVWRDYPRNDIFDWRSLDSWLYQKVAGVGTGNGTYTLGP